MFNLEQFSLSAASIFIVLLAFALANLPFINPRLFGCLPVPGGHKSARKHLVWQFAELVILYFFTGVVSRVLEARAGTVFVQGWPFYVVTVCLFLIFAAPGFTRCYLLKPSAVKSSFSNADLKEMICKS